MSKPDVLNPGKMTFFLPSFRGGGAEANVVRLTNKLALDGYAVEILALNLEGGWKESVHESVSIVSLGTQKASKSLLPLISYLRTDPPAYFISNLSHLNVLSVVARFFARVKSKLVLWEHNDIQATHDFEPKSLPKVVRAGMRKLYPHADRIFAVSEGVKESLIFKMGIDPKKVVVIHNIVDFTTIEATHKQLPDHPWLINQEKLTIISAGRLVYQKGFDLLLDAFSQLVEDMDARLIIIGEGPLRSALMDQAIRLKIEDKVDFAGFVFPPYAWFAAADMFVLSSRYEGFGIVLAEAMACGTPVIAFDCRSGPDEILDQGEVGLLVPAASTSLLYENMRRLSQDPILAKALMERGLRKSKEFHVDAISNIFLRALP